MFLDSIRSVVITFFFSSRRRHTRCLTEKINKNEVFFNTTGIHKEAIIEELQYVKQDKMDSDNKKQVLRKEKVKELLNRSPDYSDMIMMRYFFELNNKPIEWKIY